MPTIQLAGDYSIPVGTTFVIDSSKGFQAPLADGRTPSPHLDIAGAAIFEGSASPGTTISLVAGEVMASVRIDAGASVTMTSTNPITMLWVNYSGDFTNDGVVRITSGNAVGVQSGVASGNVVNNGVVEITATAGAAAGFSLWNTASFVNTGSITVHGAGFSPSVGVAAGTLGADFTNSGSIVVASNPQAPSMAVVVEMENGRFTNSGLIEGDYALKANYFGRSFGVTFDNSGTLRGIVDLGPGSDTLLNRGVIVGPVNLGDGNDVYDGRLGSTDGLVSGGLGNDSLVGQAGFDYLQGNAGDDTVDGGAGGDDWLVGGQGNDVVAAHTGGNILYGNLGNDTLSGGSGAEILRGGQGDDSISGGGGNDWISGDRGNDTESGGPGADIFHTFSGAGIDKVLDFNLAEGDRVQVDPGTAYTVSQVGADTVIDMGNGDQMILVGVQLSSLTGTWIFTA